MSNSIQFSEQFYLSTYPDVAAAVSRGVFASGQAHYNANGRFEGRNPNQFFNTSEYLGRYPDVARAGVNPLDHFLRSGAAEGRFANSNEDGVIDLNNNDIADDFNAAAYLAQYPDVAAQTGAGRPFATAYQHFVQFGQFEGRTATLSNGTTVTGPFVNGGTTGGATGSSFTLTTGIDNLNGTNGNDTFTADNTTLQATDTISGGQGIDTLNITDGGTTGGNIAAATVTGVEVINLRNVNGTAAVAGANETVTLTFSDVAGGTATTSSVSVGGQTVTTAAGGTLTGTDLAVRFGTTELPAGYTFVSQTGNQLVLRSTAAANVPDIAVNATPGGGAGAAAAAPARAIVQGVDASASTGVADTLSAANFVGATSFNSINSTNTVNVNDLAQGQSVGIIGNGSTTNGSLNGAYNAAATAATINVSGGTKAGTIAITGNGLTSTTVNSTGAANTLTGLTLAPATTTATIAAATNLTTGTVTAAGLTTLNVTGSASSVDVGQLTVAVTTVDASGLTVGGLTATVDAAITSLKGGQGSDVITTGTITSTTAGIINAGAGTDTLVVAAAADVNSATKGALYTGFETLRNNAGANIDASLIAGITSVEANNAAAGFTKLTAGQAANIKVLQTNTSGTFALTTATGTADVLGLTLAPALATAVATPIDVTGITVTGFETVNVLSSSGTKASTTVSAGNDLAFAAAGDLTTINIGGEYDLSLNTANITKAVTVNSVQSGTAVLNVTGNVVKGSVINTTANADIITTTATVTGTSGEFVTYNAGAGNDTISTTAAAVNNTSAANASLKIDGGAGVDTVNFTAAGTALVDGNFQYITNVEKIGFTGGGAISVTSGGFFDTNFKAAGAELTGSFGTTGGGAGAAANIDLTSFSGVAKVTLSEVATGDAGNSFAVNTGSGADVVSIITNGTLTTQNTVNTGLGNDTITLNNLAIAGGGSITVNAGGGNDTIVGGASTSTLIGGAGVDTLTGGGAADTFSFSKGDSGITTGNIDIITDFLVGTDKLQFAGVTEQASAQQAAVQTAVSALAAGSTVTQIGAAMATANVTDNAVSFATFGGNTYVYFEAAGNSTGVEANDLLVQLTGVTTIPVFANDVVA